MKIDNIKSNLEIKQAPGGRFAGMIIRNVKTENVTMIKNQNPALECNKGQFVDVYA
jgi:hypothetical protein